MLGIWSQQTVEERPEVKAWTDMIYYRNIPVKKAELAKSLADSNAKLTKKKGGKKKGTEKDLEIQRKPQFREVKSNNVSPGFKAQSHSELV